MNDSKNGVFSKIRNQYGVKALKDVRGFLYYVGKIARVKNQLAFASKCDACNLFPGGYKDKDIDSVEINKQHLLDQISEYKGKLKHLRKRVKALKEKFSANYVNVFKSIIRYAKVFYDVEDKRIQMSYKSKFQRLLADTKSGDYISKFPGNDRLNSSHETTASNNTPHSNSRNNISCSRTGLNSPDYSDHYIQVQSHKGDLSSRDALLEPVSPLAVSDAPLSPVSDCSENLIDISTARIIPLERDNLDTKLKYFGEKYSNQVSVKPKENKLLKNQNVIDCVSLDLGLEDAKSLPLSKEDIENLQKDLSPDLVDVTDDEPDSTSLENTDICNVTPNSNVSSDVEIIDANNSFSSQLSTINSCSYTTNIISLSPTVVSPSSTNMLSSSFGLSANVQPSSLVVSSVDVQSSLLNVVSSVDIAPLSTGVSSSSVDVFCSESSHTLSRPYLATLGSTKFRVKRRTISELVSNTSISTKMNVTTVNNTSANVFSNPVNNGFNSQYLHNDSSMTSLNNQILNVSSAFSSNIPYLQTNYCQNSLPVNSLTTVPVHTTMIQPSMLNLTPFNGSNCIVITNLTNNVLYSDLVYLFRNFVPVDIVILTDFNLICTGAAYARFNNCFTAQKACIFSNQTMLHSVPIFVSICHIQEFNDAQRNFTAAMFERERQHEKRREAMKSYKNSNLISVSLNSSVIQSISQLPKKSDSHSSVKDVITSSNEDPISTIRQTFTISSPDILPNSCHSSTVDLPLRNDPRIAARSNLTDLDPRKNTINIVSNDVSPTLENHSDTINNENLSNLIEKDPRRLARLVNIDKNMDSVISSVSHKNKNSIEMSLEDHENVATTLKSSEDIVSNCIDENPNLEEVDANADISNTTPKDDINDVNKLLSNKNPNILNILLSNVDTDGLCKVLSITDKTKKSRDSSNDISGTECITTNEPNIDSSIIDGNAVENEKTQLNLESTKEFSTTGEISFADYLDKSEIEIDLLNKNGTISCDKVKNSLTDVVVCNSELKNDILNCNEIDRIEDDSKLVTDSVISNEVEMQVCDKDNVGSLKLFNDGVDLNDNSNMIEGDKSIDSNGNINHNDDIIVDDGVNNIHDFSNGLGMKKIPESENITSVLNINSESVQSLESVHDCIEEFPNKSDSEKHLNIPNADFEKLKVNDKNNKLSLDDVMDFLKEQDAKVNFSTNLQDIKSSNLENKDVSLANVLNKLNAFSKLFIYKHKKRKLAKIRRLKIAKFRAKRKRHQQIKKFNLLIQEKSSSAVSNQEDTSMFRITESGLENVNRALINKQSLEMSSASFKLFSDLSSLPSLRSYIYFSNGTIGSLFKQLYERNFIVNLLHVRLLSLLVDRLNPQNYLSRQHVSNDKVRKRLRDSVVAPSKVQKIHSNFQMFKKHNISTVKHDTQTDFYTNLSPVEINEWNSFESDCLSNTLKGDQSRLMRELWGSIACKDHLSVCQVSHSAMQLLNDFDQYDATFCQPQAQSTSGVIRVRRLSGDKYSNESVPAKKLRISSVKSLSSENAMPLMDFSDQIANMPAWYNLRLLKDRAASRCASNHTYNPRHLFKCGALHCNFSTNQGSLFEFHIINHPACAVCERVNRDVTMCQQMAGDCVYCGYHGNSLRCHVISEHVRSVYQCVHCFYRTQHMDYLRMHLRRWHSRQKAVIVICKLPSNWSKVLNKEQRDSCPHVNFVPYVCIHDMCNCSFVDPELFAQHCAKQHSLATSFACHICYDRSSTIHQLVDHYKQHGYYLYNCSFCKFGANVPAEIRDHMVDVHPDSPDHCVKRGSQGGWESTTNSSLKVKATSSAVSICSAEFQTEDLSSAREFTVITDTTDLVDNQRRSSADQLAIVPIPALVPRTTSPPVHREELENLVTSLPYTEPTPFVTSSGVTSSLPDHTTSDQSSFPQVKTEPAEPMECENGFSTMAVIADQTEVANPELDPVPPDTDCGVSPCQQQIHLSIPDDKLFRCHSCAQLFCTGKQFRHHLDNSSCASEHCHFCYHCKERLLSSVRLIRHLRLCHSQRPYVCSLCAFTSSLSGVVSQHLRSVHKLKCASFTLFLLSQCTRAWQDWYTAACDSATSDGDNLKHYTCVDDAVNLRAMVCARVCSPAHLPCLRASDIHLDDPYQPPSHLLLQSAYCASVWSQPAKCPHCDYSTVISRNLRRHLRLRHPDVPDHNSADKSPARNHRNHGHPNSHSQESIETRKPVPPNYVVSAQADTHTPPIDDQHQTSGLSSAVWRCVLCRHEFGSRSAIFEHLCHTHVLPLSHPCTRYKCAYCSVFYCASLRHLSAHHGQCHKQQQTGVRAFALYTVHSPLHTVQQSQIRPLWQARPPTASAALSHSCLSVSRMRRIMPHVSRRAVNRSSADKVSLSIPTVSVTTGDPPLSTPSPILVVTPTSNCSVVATSQQATSSSNCRVTYVASASRNTTTVATATSSVAVTRPHSSLAVSPAGRLLQAQQMFGNFADLCSSAQRYFGCPRCSFKTKIKSRMREHLYLKLGYTG